MCSAKSQLSLYSFHSVIMSPISHNIPWRLVLCGRRCTCSLCCSLRLGARKSMTSMFSLGKTHIKLCFFSGRTTKGVGRVNLPPPATKKKNYFFSLNSGCFSPKIVKKKNLSTSVRLKKNKKNKPLVQGG